MVRVGNGAGGETGRYIRVIGLLRPIVPPANQNPRDSVQCARLLTPTAVVEITRILMQNRGQKRAADQPAHRLIPIRSAEPLGIPLGALAVSGRIILGLADAGENSCAGKGERA